MHTMAFDKADVVDSIDFTCEVQGGVSWVLLLETMRMSGT